MKQTCLWFFSLALAMALGLGAGCGKRPEDAKISSDIQGKFSQDSGLFDQATDGTDKQRRGHARRHGRK